MGMDLIVVRHRRSGKPPGAPRLALVHHIEAAFNPDKPRFICIEHLNVIVQIGAFEQQVIHNHVTTKLRERGDGSAHTRKHALSIIPESNMGDPFSVTFFWHHIQARCPRITSRRVQASDPTGHPVTELI